MYKFIKSKIQLIYIDILCSLLYIKNLLISKKLFVINFVYTDKLIIRGNETELNWKVTGCHKITIANKTILPGNIKNLNFKLEKKINYLNVTFYGIGGQKQTKKITIESTSPSVLSTFSFKTNLSDLSSVPLIRKNLKKTLDDSFNYQVQKKIKINKPKIVSRKLTINFESFIKTNHPINQ